mgnify:CR=1 FL=1
MIDTEHAARMNIGQSKELDGTPEIAVTITKISEDHVTATYTHKPSSQLVLRTRMGIHAGNSSLEDIAVPFWDITIDGQRGTVDDIKAANGPMSMKVKPKTRSLIVETR